MLDIFADIRKKLATQTSPFYDGLSGISGISKNNHGNINFWNQKTWFEYLKNTGVNQNAWNKFFTELAGGGVAEDNLKTAWERMLVLSFYSRFINREDVWLKAWHFKKDNEDIYGYNTMHQAQKKGEFTALSVDHVIAHLSGKITLSAPTANKDGLCKWACWDEDAEKGYLEKITAVLTELNFHPIHEGKREGKNGHLWLFFNEPIPMKDLQYFNAFILTASNIERDEFKAKDGALEFFPKNTKGEITIGGAVRLPLGIHLKTNKMSWFEGQDQLKEWQLYWIHSQPFDIADRVKRLADFQRTKMTKIETSNYIYSSINKVYLNKERINIIPYVRNLRRVGKEYSAACPCCQREGLDKTGDNLRITIDGKTFNCVQGGPGQQHKTKDIFQSLGIQLSRE